MKDWKGNDNATHAALAAKKPESKTIREENDFYATDPKALEMLLDNCTRYIKKELELCKFDKYGEVFFIWECACGDGNLAKVLKDRGYNNIATDIKNRGYGAIGSTDFLHTRTDDQIRIILTNPPYSLATEFIEHALEILPDGGLYIALMNITYLSGQKRFERVYSKGTLREVYIFSKRIECWKNNERPKDKCGSMANYAWYVFQKGYNGQPTLYWL